MSSRRLRSALADERGIALPLSLIVLALLTSLTLAFLAMSATEPLIAANLQAGEQALALAEAGVERATWALNNPTAAAPAQGLSNPLPVPAPSPYAGQTVNLGAGSYAVIVSLPAGAAVGNDRNIDATGTVGSARRKVRVTLTSIGDFPLNIPGALTVAGAVQLTGNSSVNGNDSAPGTPNACANKAGVTIRDKTTLSDGVTKVDNTISGDDGPPHDRAIGSPDKQSLPEDGFGVHLLSSAQLETLKALAQSQGTYIKPTSNTEFDLSVVNGLMFVDTVNGAALGSPPDTSKLAKVKITGADNSGWLIVMGKITIDGNVTYNGLMYALNDISYRGTGTGGIYGAMVSANVVDSVATVVDTDTSGNAKVYYDCTKVANGGGAFNPQAAQPGKVGYFVVGGTWKEVSN